MVEPIYPMLAKSIKDLNGNGIDYEGWYANKKYDGVRCIAKISNIGTVLQARSGSNITSKYPELQTKTEHTIILDGELIVGEGSKKDFPLIQQRQHLGNDFRIRLLSQRQPVKYAIFDVLYFGDGWITDFPLFERLDMLKKASDEIDNCNYIIVDYAEATEIDDMTLSKDAEGFMLKRKDSPYEIDTRSKTWLKLPFLGSMECYIIGYMRSEAISRANTFRSLLLGKNNGDGEIEYIGRVGSGFSDRDLNQLSELFKTVSCRRVKGGIVEFVDKTFKCKVRYLDISKGGILRQPVFEGLIGGK